MRGPDDTLSRWALERRQERQATNSHEVYGLSDPSMKPLVGWGGAILRSSDNHVGARELEVEFRPVLLGHVELRIRLAAQSPQASRAHSKSAYLYASPTALRELAEQLLATADAAEALKLKPKPVK